MPTTGPMPTTATMPTMPTTRTRARHAPTAPDGVVRHALVASSLGLVLVAVGDAGVRLVLLGDDADLLRSELRARLRRATHVPADEADDLARSLAARVAECVDGRADVGDLPLDARGTAFQREVWAALRQVPAGATTTYAALAGRVGRPLAVRAVAGACAANPLAVLVPCHRVVRADGGLSGYRWGVERKRRLLAREGAR